MPGRRRTLYDATITAFADELPEIQRRLTSAVDVPAPLTRTELYDVAKVLHLARESDAFGDSDGPRVPEWLFPVVHKVLRSAYQRTHAGTSKGHTAPADRAWRAEQTRVRRYVRVLSWTHPVDGPPLTKAAAYRLVEYEEVQMGWEEAPLGHARSSPYEAYGGARVKVDCLKLEQTYTGSQLERWIAERADASAISWIADDRPNLTPTQVEKGQRKVAEAARYERDRARRRR